VILLDEVEKAHPEVMNVLLQLLDDGRLTDGKGRVVDFRNSLVVMTSNLGQDDRFEPVGSEPAEARERRQRAVLEELARHFRPEFLNRLDAVVRFRRLGREQIDQIVRLELMKVNRALAEQDIHLDVSDAAVARLADMGWDPQFGARPVKRVIQREVQDRLADAILAGEVLPEQAVTLDENEGRFVLQAVSREPRP
jgi:ATP-dependent Clp protease ATP-binding subunit ClpA